MNIAIILLLIGGIVFTLGDLIMKKWALTNSHLFYLIGMGLYIVGLAFLAQSYKYKHIGIASAIIVLINIIALSLVSYFYFKETLSLAHIFGLVLGMISILIIELT